MEVSGQLHAPAALSSGERASGAESKGCWVDNTKLNGYRLRSFWDQTYGAERHISIMPSFYAFLHKMDNHRILYILYDEIHRVGVMLELH
jgi:hypothetical protein